MNSHVRVFFCVFACVYVTDNVAVLFCASYEVYFVACYPNAHHLMVVEYRLPNVLQRTRVYYELNCFSATYKLDTVNENVLHKE